LAIGITAVAYGAIGFYFVSQKYELAPAPADEPTVFTGSWTVIERPRPPTIKQKQPPQPVPTRHPPTSIPTDAPISPFPPNDTPVRDVMPTTPDLVPPTPVVANDPPAPTVTTAPPGIIRNPVWISRPTPEQVGRLYPQRAIDRGITGTATLWCGIRANGTMTDCQVVDESPAGWRFGAAALSMAQYFRISPKTVDGKPVEGSRVRIPVVFALPE
jgi:protein TonB